MTATYSKQQTPLPQWRWSVRYYSESGLINRYHFVKRMAEQQQRNLLRSGIFCELIEQVLDEDFYIYRDSVEMHYDTTTCGC